ncbi:zinc dependent phospholipase C family protein [Oceanobacillus iheyensis]|uniref:zinc dependent phospholipase C family protein n=1 Tax=Oceanobacillus iheyensis TaxID=182710 RepID=UPI003634C264
MGSRIMHLIIAKRITEHFPIEDVHPFLIGGIAADAITPKDSSHFYTGSLENYTRTIDYMGFIEKYAEYKTNPYVLGYFSHLVADDLWLQGFYLPWLKNRMESNKEIFQLYHQDYRILNAKLLEFYDCKNELNAHLKSNIEIKDLDEVKSQDIKNFIDCVLDDMRYSNKELEAILNVFSLQQIIGYIETSVERAIYFMKKLSK